MSTPTHKIVRLERLTAFLFLYATFTYGCGALAVGLGCGAWASGDFSAMAAFWAVVGAYGFAAASFMMRAGWSLARRRVAGPNGVRFALAFALPGSALVGLLAAFVAFVGVDAGFFPVALVALLLFAMCAASAVTLVRLLWLHDLDALLWHIESEAKAFDDTLNFVE